MAGGYKSAVLKLALFSLMSTLFIGIFFRSTNYSYKIASRFKEHVRPSFFLKVAGLLTSDVDRDGNIDNVGRSVKSKSRAKKLVLLYTSWFDRKPWPSVPKDYDFKDYDGTKCPVTLCEVTYDHEKLKESDLVIFHGCDMPSVKEMRSQRRMNRDQFWAMYVHESPENSGFDPSEHNDLFNWTITYRVDSDVYYPYWHAQALLKPIKVRENFAKGKTKLMIVINSHCDDARMGLIGTLMKYIQLDVYGRCRRLFKQNLPNCPRSSEACVAIRKQYKFYFAYENGFCKDYVTEKYWLNALEAGLVPVVLGGANYSDSRVAVPGSYINALDFPSLAHLGAYLKYLDGNDTAYNEYHSWRGQYRLLDRHLLCDVCKKINSLPLEKKQVDMVDFWGWSQNCRNSETSVQHFIEDSFKLDKFFLRSI